MEDLWVKKQLHLPVVGQCIHVSMKQQTNDSTNHKMFHMLQDFSHVSSMPSISTTAKYLCIGVLRTPKTSQKVTYHSNCTTPRLQPLLTSQPEAPPPEAPPDNPSQPNSLPKKIKSGQIIFCIIWELGGPSGVQNTPTGCGNDFHTREINFQKIIFV